MTQRRRLEPKRLGSQKKSAEFFAGNRNGPAATRFCRCVQRHILSKRRSRRQSHEPSRTIPRPCRTPACPGGARTQPGAAGAVGKPVPVLRAAGRAGRPEQPHGHRLRIGPLQQIRRSGQGTCLILRGTRHLLFRSSTSWRRLPHGVQPASRATLFTRCSFHFPSRSSFRPLFVTWPTGRLQTTRGPQRHFGSLVRAS